MWDPRQVTANFTRYPEAGLWRQVNQHSADRLAFSPQNPCKTSQVWWCVLATVLRACHTSTAGIEESKPLASQASLLGEFLTNEKPCLEKQGGRYLRNSRECPLISTHMHVPTRANKMQMKSPDGRGGLQDYRQFVSASGNRVSGALASLKDNNGSSRMRGTKKNLCWVFRNPLLLTKLRHSHNHNGFVLGVLFFNSEIS